MWVQLRIHLFAWIFTTFHAYNFHLDEFIFIVIRPHWLKNIIQLDLNTVVKVPSSRSWFYKQWVLTSSIPSSLNLKEAILCAPTTMIAQGTRRILEADHLCCTVTTQDLRFSTRLSSRNSTTTVHHRSPTHLTNRTRAQLLTLEMPRETSWARTLYRDSHSSAHQMRILRNLGIVI